MRQSLSRPMLCSDWFLKNGGAGCCGLEFAYCAYIGLHYAQKDFCVKRKFKAKKNPHMAGLVI